MCRLITAAAAVCVRLYKLDDGCVCVCAGGGAHDAFIVTFVYHKHRRQMLWALTLLWVVLCNFTGDQGHPYNDKAVSSSCVLRLSMFTLHVCRANHFCLFEFCNRM